MARRCRLFAARNGVWRSALLTAKACVMDFQFVQNQKDFLGVVGDQLAHKVDEATPRSWPVSYVWPSMRGYSRGHRP